MLSKKASLYKAPIGILLVLCFLVQCRTDDKDAVLEMNQMSDSLSVEKASNVTILYSDSGILKAKIFAPILERHPAEKEPFSEMPAGVKAQFYDKNESENSRISALYGIHYEKKKLIKLQNDVQVTNTRNQRLSSEELFWDQVKKELYTEKFVDIRDDEDVWQGQGFRSNETFTRWRIIKPTGRKKVKDLNPDES